MRTLLLSFLTLITLSACAPFDMIGNTPKIGGITTSYSDFDDSTEITLAPVGVWAMNSRGESTGGFSVGLYKNSRMDKNEVLMVVRYLGAENIESGKSLHLKIDGKPVSLSTADSNTDIETHSGYPAAGFGAYNTSSRRYVASVSLVNQIAKSKKTLGRLNFLDSSYTEGALISPAYDSFEVGGGVKKLRESFQDFLREIEKL